VVLGASASGWPDSNLAGSCRKPTGWRPKRDANTSPEGRDIIPSVLAAIFDSPPQRGWGGRHAARIPEKETRTGAQRAHSASTERELGIPGSVFVLLKLGLAGCVPREVSHKGVFFFKIISRIFNSRLFWMVPKLCLSNIIKIFYGGIPSEYRGE
jgi:hypothetical protein